MQKKNIFKTLALAMLMPTMLLTTACSSEDDVVNSNIANLETVANKGYALPVTVNVTREGDKGSNRAAYTDNGDGTGSLGFSAGDKLFVKGHASGTAGFFAGTLTMVSAGTFSGTIYTENLYDGDADALLAEAGMVRATLLPDGYETPGFLSISGSGATASISSDASKAFATSKAAAVEQFSYEMSTTYSSGFALSPANVILNFTITGLTASTEVTASFTDEYSKVISGNVTTDGSGNATFAIGVAGNTNLKYCSLTVGGNAITLTSSDKYLTEGKIYNITRPATVDLSSSSGFFNVTGDMIITGTPAGDLNIKLPNKECTVTLDNVNPLGAHSVIIQSGTSNMTVKLKGTSKLESIQAYAAPALIIDEAAPGGTVIIESDNYTPLDNDHVTINGGTVMARFNYNDYEVVSGDLTVNGGAVYLAATGHVPAVYGTISGSVTLYGWNGSQWDSSDTATQYVTSDNTSGAPASWTYWQ